ncbi:MAG: UDP-glucose 6-dehydrogenase, partial [Dehalococcoidales bacterium]|nr:UDP-glucose 6-dehydrogenase [Dehalococcoidales bacterium]
MRSICIIGVGYVGLVTGACLAELGNSVTCLDCDSQKVEGLHQGIMPIYEPGLEDLVRRNQVAGRLRVTTSYAEAIPQAEMVFIAVGTPSGVVGQADLQYVEEAARETARHIDRPLILVNKSTVPIGTGDLVSDIVRDFNGNGAPFSVVSNP